MSTRPVAPIVTALCSWVSSRPTAVLGNGRINTSRPLQAPCDQALVWTWAESSSVSYEELPKSAIIHERVLA